MQDEDLDYLSADVSLFVQGTVGKSEIKERNLHCTKRRKFSEAAGFESQLGRKGNGGPSDWTEGRRLKKEARSLVEKQVLKIGLSTSLPPSNLGFRLLSKMGYKEGEGIGKQQGRIEPVEISIKSGRGGIGAEPSNHESGYEKELKRLETRQQGVEQLHEALRKDFENAKLQDWKSKRVANDYWKARKILSELDERSKIIRDDVVAPDLSSRKRLNDSSNSANICSLAARYSPDSSGLLQPHDKFNEDAEVAFAAMENGHADAHAARRRSANVAAIVTVRVANADVVQADVEADVALKNRGAHSLDERRGRNQEEGGRIELKRKENGEGGGKGEERQGAEATALDEEEGPSEESLSVLLDLLRMEHLYCLYCGAKFETKHEMDAVCPGKDWDAH